MRHVFFQGPAAGLTVAAVLLSCLPLVRAQDGAAAPAAGKLAETKAAADARRRPLAVGVALPDDLVLRPLAGAVEGREGAVEPVAVRALPGTRGKPIVLIFWSSRCPVCARYLEALATLREKHGEKAIFAFAVTDRDGTPDEIRSRIAEQKFTGAVHFDADGAAARRLGVRVSPTALVIDAEGVLHYRGPIDDDRRKRGRDMRELLGPAIEAVLAGKNVETGDIRAFGSSLR